MATEMELEQAKLKGYMHACKATINADQEEFELDFYKARAIELDNQIKLSKDYLERIMVDCKDICMLAICIDNFKNTITGLGDLEVAECNEAMYGSIFRLADMLSKNISDLLDAGSASDVNELIQAKNAKWW